MDSDPGWIRIRDGFGFGMDSDPGWIRIRDGFESGFDIDRIRIGSNIRVSLCWGVWVWTRGFKKSLNPDKVIYNSTF